MASLLHRAAALVCSGWLTAATKSGLDETELQHRCRSLLRRVPYWARGHLFVGTAALTSGDLRTGYASAQALVTLEPAAPSSWILLARCRIAAHQFESAVELARKALTLDPSNGEAREELAAALIPLERYDEASEALHAIPVSSRTRPVLSMLSYLTYRNSRTAATDGASST